MTLYRNRDVVEKPKPVISIAGYIAVGGGLTYFLRSLFPTTTMQLMVWGGAVGFIAVVHLIWMWVPARMKLVNAFQVKNYREKQGRLDPEEIEAQGLILKVPGVPFASLEVNPEKRKTKMVGLPIEKLQGHGAGIGTTRSGKGMLLTTRLLESNCSMFVVDPKGEQFARTAGFREENVGPVWRIPGNTLDLSAYYDLDNNDHLSELHFHLMKPWADKQAIFADKAKFLFRAGNNYAREFGLNPIRVLLDAAQSSPVEVLEAFQSVDYDSVMNFTNGDDPDSMDKFSQSSWGSFGTRFFDYQQHWHTLTGSGATSIPADWAAQNGTIYITYSFDELKGAGGAVSAIVAALLRYQKMNDLRDRIIGDIDELPVVGLRNISEYLATVGGYNISLMLYVQTYSQLSEAYGERGAETILSNCHHQVWYPPADSITAERMSKIYGTKLEPYQTFMHRTKDKVLIPDLGTKEDGRSVNYATVPALTPEEMNALPPDEVIVQLDRRWRFKAYRCWPVPEFGHIPSPSFSIETDLVREKPVWKKKGVALATPPQVSDLAEHPMDPTVN